jgi:hypothetical protein
VDIREKHTMKLKDMAVILLLIAAAAAIIAA